jgi:cytochrome c biogenesis protein CcdA/glutaredoxin
MVAPSHRPRGRRSGLVVALGTLLGLLLLVVAPAGASEPVTLLYFGADGCPYCAQMETYLDDLEERFGDDLEVIRHELSSDPAARDRWVRELAERGHQASGVPVTILGDQVWLGFDAPIGARIEQAVVAAIEDRAAAEPAGGIEPATRDTTVAVPLLGEVDAGARSALAATALIALIDGFNPCSLWVLVVLLAMVLNAGATRGRVALVGGTFLTVTGLIYGVFIAGVFTVLGFIEHLGAIRIGVAILALFVGAVNVKDHLAYKKGLSFTIPDRFKPRIYRGGRAIRRTDRPLAAVLGTTVAMAAGISLVELPCTAGFPVIWSGIVRTQGVEGTGFAALLALYLFIYILDELALFLVAVVTLRVGRFEERHGRLLKLVGGSVMIALGTVLLAAPRLMEDLAAAVLVILGAVAVALLFDRVHRRVTATP